MAEGSKSVNPFRLPPNIRNHLHFVSAVKECFGWQSLCPAPRALSSEPLPPPSPDNPPDYRASALSLLIIMKKLYILVQRNFAAAERYYRILFYILCLLILVSAVIKIGGALDKKVGIGELKIRLDHLLHALAYFIFSMYYIAGRYFGLKLFERHEHLLFFLIIFVLGFLAEVLQIWVPYRSFSMMDMLANIVGIGIGFGITVLLLKRYDVMAL